MNYHPVAKSAFRSGSGITLLTNAMGQIVKKGNFMCSTHC